MMLEVFLTVFGSAVIFFLVTSLEGEKKFARDCARAQRFDSSEFKEFKLPAGQKGERG